MTCGRSTGKGNVRASSDARRPCILGPFMNPARPTNSDHPPPERVAHYRILRKLGEGGMGVVYAARDERLERDVAIKMIRAGARSAPRASGCWREARAAAAVNHPNVCQLYEVGDDERRAVHRHGAARGRVAGGAHRAGADAAGRGGRRSRCRCWPRSSRCTGAASLHRDLKPSNVFLTPHGVKLLDFGLARPFAERPGARRPAHHVRHGDRHAALHGAGAARLRRRRRARRPVRGRRDPVRDARRAVRRSPGAACSRSSTP